MITEDKRNIARIQLNDGTTFEDKYYRIVAYKECGQMGYIPWFNIYYKDDKEPMYRMNGAYVTLIDYAPKRKD